MESCERKAISTIQTVAPSTLNEIRFGQGDNVTEAALYCLCDTQDVAAIPFSQG